MRQIVLDTETTGLEHAQGHRIIEIGAVEIIDRRFAQTPFHHYINPKREIDEGAKAVHGITEEFLSDKPTFDKICQSFLEYIKGAELIIHNAEFDVGFLNAELSRLKLPMIESIAARVTDSLAMARGRFPGKRNTLDALCERFDIDNSHRTFHGAALDAQLLGEVYLAMTRGQESLIATDNFSADSQMARYARPKSFIVRRASVAELEAHAKLRAIIDKSSGGKTIWKTVDPSNQ